MTTTLFQDPYEMLLFLDDSLLEEKEKLYSWQKQFMIDFAAGDWNAKTPFKAVVRAANGSGKDKYIIAACVVWFCMKFQNAVAVVTSASGTQLDRQTSTYIKQLAQAFNTKVGAVMWKINYRHYEFQHKQQENEFDEEIKSTVELFVTDEAGRAEGWHNIVPGGKLAIFTSESKSIPDEIFTALSRCTGFTHRVDVSSPGLPMGFFHNTCKSAKNRKEITTVSEWVQQGWWIEYHITAYDCLHLANETYIEELARTMPGGRTGAAFQSCVMAEFGTNDELTVIPYQHVWRAVNRVGDTIGWLSEPQNTAGLDLAAGGDETVLAIRNGNKLLKVIPFKFNNTQDTVNFLIEKFKENALDKPQSYIYADAGGLGKPIIDQLRSKGWTNIRYVLNQNKAYNERVYLNRGAEMWFNFGKLLETGEVWLCQDDKLVRQLAGRYYKITDGNKHKLESKLVARAAGRPSPDRADAVVLAFSMYKTKLEQDDSKVKIVWDEKDLPKSEPLQPAFDLRVQVKSKDENYFTGFSTTFPRNTQADFKRLKLLVNKINQSRVVEVK